MKKLAIFDLDGTLLNTIEDLGRATNYALETNGYASHAISAYPFFVGNGVRRLIEQALPDEARKPEIIDHLLIDFKNYYNDHNTDYSSPYPGITELLNTLTEKGISIAVASNKYQLATTKLVKHYFPKIDFVCVAGQKEGVPVKPDPSIVFEILATAQIPKADVIYIGDSGVDMETARRACIESVGVTWGFRSEKELVQNFANHIINKPEEIIDLL